VAHHGGALLEGDGVTFASAFVRNPKQVIGVGYLEALASEMTRDLQAAVANGRQAAAAQNSAQTVTLATKGVSFGTVVVRADGTLDTANVKGIDADFVVKPFGWKGRTASLRRFIEDAFQVHLGLQFETLTRAHCASPIPARVGGGADCEDPDNDGVKRELTEGQLTALSVYASLQQAPTETPTEDVAKAQRIREGRTIFEQLGCASCHVPTLELRDPMLSHVSDSTKKAFDVSLPLDGEPPQLEITGEGTVLVPLYSDLKRHDMGEALDERRPSAGVDGKMFLTPPLWGLAASAPYMHDGRTRTDVFVDGIYTAIDKHLGEASASRDAFRAMIDEDSARFLSPRRVTLLYEFLQSLSRDPAQTKER